MSINPKTYLDPSDISGALAPSVQNGITAFAGGGQANARLLTRTINRVTTVATIADSVKLPPATAGMRVVVINAGANSMNVFPSTGGIINALSANAAFAMAANKTAEFVCALAGTWNVNLTA
jgi:hypothetical protein